MGYHIFMARKVQLTSAKNNAYASMMNQWMEQEHVADQQISLMTERNTALQTYADSYQQDRDAANREYNNLLNQKATFDKYTRETDPTEKQRILDEFQNGDTTKQLTDVDPDAEFRNSHNGKSISDYLNDLADDYKEDKERYNNEYSVDYQLLTDQETRIEQAIQVLETHISEYTQEMQKVEQQEATEIKTCIPNYNGAGGGQG